MNKQTNKQTNEQTNEQTNKQKAYKYKHLSLDQAKERCRPLYLGFILDFTGM